MGRRDQESHKGKAAGHRARPQQDEAGVTGPWEAEVLYLATKSRTQIALGFLEARARLETPLKDDSK